MSGEMRLRRVMFVGEHRVGHQTTSIYSCDVIHRRCPPRSRPRYIDGTAWRLSTFLVPVHAAAPPPYNVCFVFQRPASGGMRCALCTSFRDRATFLFSSTSVAGSPSYRPAAGTRNVPPSPVQRSGLTARLGLLLLGEWRCVDVGAM